MSTDPHAAEAAAYSFRSAAPVAAPHRFAPDTVAAATAVVVVALMYAFFMVLREPPAASGAAALPLPIASAVATETRPRPTHASSVSAAVYENHRHGQALVAQWIAAWARRDAATHLSLYSASFRPADGSTREAWEARRKKEILAAERFVPSARELRIEHSSPDRLVAHFAKEAAGEPRRDDHRLVTLVLVREGAQWRIAAETYESLSPRQAKLRSATPA